MTWIEVQKQLLIGEPGPLESLLSVDKPAVYAWWDLGGGLDNFYPIGFPTVDFRQPLYVGMAGNLKLRFQKNHRRKISQSSPRLSLAALLFAELGLLQGAEVRGEKLKLDRDAEGRLTYWINNHILFTHIVVDGDHVEDYETKIIQHLLPPLNIKKAVDSPYKAALCAQRAVFQRAIERHARPKIMGRT